jgi:glutathione synthase/RimK-type ligase-like ATP-grasp enzyme
VDLCELSGVYVRYLGSEGRSRLSGVPESSVPALHAECDTGLMALFEELECLVVNRVGGGMSNHSKPYQGLLVGRCGLRTPPTLVTNDPDAVLEFLEAHGGEVIYKSLSGVRSIVRRVGPEHLARLPLLQHGPAQFQAFIPGDNVRVHTVGDQLFATRVFSNVVDYRYARRDGGDVQMVPFELPSEIAEACRRVARALDVTLAGIDLKRTPEGDYYCFEVNPSPGFLYYEQHTGQPISLALAELLHTGRHARLAVE